jgi:hypothetical protein
MSELQSINRHMAGVNAKFIFQVFMRAPNTTNPAFIQTPTKSYTAPVNVFLQFSKCYGNKGES